uniref:Proliferating cell nuclear antigen n=1 Tax=Panagrolaimus superbus TaxID=310955 RepID=A0A914Y4T2_9BILA
MEIRLSETEVFSSYRMDGFSEERNYIVMTLSGSEFARILENDDDKVRLKLVKRNDKPMLNADCQNNEFSKCVPVTICKANDYIDFKTPTINPPVVGLIVKQIDSFKDIIETFFTLEVECVEMKLFPGGELKIKGVTESRDEYTITFDELSVLDEIEGAQESDVFRVNVKNIFHFIGCLPHEAKRFIIRVSDLNQIVFSVKHSTLEYLFYMSSMVQEIN